ncbi:glycoside hydrolase family 3 C-terminal domain-containing protein [Actinomadura sp. NAK00032]|uniref:glycoside hydrolase family 3 protein n=1 Tax=Actinomadura sp. NAK00032 TaxID=2742128 RepID=UPI0015924CEA|nr:glycoside hydrolase family 3 protein [Actinomadura sp. NAK00032]QKW35111.1 glycoside hydrolase family 3 C-terminal domain-containing protein [Actinomadura sp. NAK00032]
MRTNGGRTLVSIAAIAALGLALCPSAAPPARAGTRPGGCDPGAQLSRMTAAEKAGQLVMAVTEDGPDGMPSDRTRRAIQELKIGSVITSEPRTPGLAARYADRLQRWAAGTRPHLPLLVSGDFEFGTTHNVREGTTPLPNAMGLGAARDPRLAREAAAITAAEARAMGFHWNYAPVADVNTNPANPIIGVRSFGERTGLVGGLVEAQVRAYRRAGMIATPKHFPGHGDTETDSHLGLPSVGYDRATLDRVHLPPFRRAIAAGADAIMTAHVVVKAIDPGLPATLSPKVLTGLLRDEMGFDGLIVTDAMDMDAIDENWGTREATAMAVKAGADVIMSTGDYTAHEEAVGALRDALRTGELSEARVDASVRRVLALKCAYRVAEHRYADPARAERISGNAAFRRRALAMGVAATTLVKNDGGVLPFDPASPERTLVAGTVQTGEFADAVAAVARGPVESWRAATTDPADAEIAEAVRRAAGADRILVATFSSGPLPAGQAGLVRALRATGKPVAAVAIGLPYDIASYPDVPAYIATYGTTARTQRVDRTMHEAAARVVFGARPGGRLPVTIKGLYPYGHGLRY